MNSDSSESHIVNGGFNELEAGTNYSTGLFSQLASYWFNKTLEPEYQLDAQNLKKTGPVNTFL